MAGLPGTHTPDFLCPSCGTRSAGIYCTACGEKKLGPHDRTLRHFLDIVVNFLTHFDSKGYRSLWYLVTRPGFLSFEQLRGSRVRYAKPFPLFLSISVLYYLSVTAFGANTFTTPLSVQLHQNDYYAAYAGRRLERVAPAAVPAQRAAFEKRYDTRTNELSKTLIFLFIPIYAFVFYGFFFRRRRQLVEHVVVATHLWCFILLVLAVLVPALAWPLVWAGRAPDVATALAANDGPLSALLQLVFGGYIACMLRRVYGASWWYCAAAATAIAWSFFHIVWLYRYFLFEITLALI